MIITVMDVPPGFSSAVNHFGSNVEVDWMNIQEVREDSYALYAEIDPSYMVNSILSIVAKDEGLGEFDFVEEEVPEPYRKGANVPDESPV